MSKAKPPVEEPLRIEYVRVATVAQWERNPKKHDFGALWQSIQRYGFKDAPKFEPALNGGKGGIVEGNGRSHVLKEMEAADEPRPAGILLEDGYWTMPVSYGVDAKDEQEAEAYGIDHNNLTMSGGDFGPNDALKMYESKSYGEVLADLSNKQVYAVTVDQDDVQATINRIAKEAGAPLDFLRDGPPSDDKPKFGVLVVCEGESDQELNYQRLRDEGYEVVKQGAKPPGVKR